MSELGDLLELLHGATARWQTIRLVRRDRHDSALMMESMRRNMAASQARGDGAGVIMSLGGDDEPETTETVRRMWLDRPGDRDRVEWTGATDHLIVRVGSQSWSWDPYRGAVIDESGAGRTPAWENDDFLDPSLILPAVDLQIIGRDAVAGRDAIVVQATLRRTNTTLTPLAHMLEGLDHVVMAVDADRGIVLRHTAYLDGQPVSVGELSEIAFDEALGDDIFRFVSPDGEPARPCSMPHPELLPLEEAARRASFTVLVPGRLPQGWGIDVTYMTATDRPRHGDSVWVGVSSPDGQSRLQVAESAEPYPSRAGGEQIEINGMVIHLTDEPVSGGWIATTEVGGTHLQAQGNLDRDTFLEILASLKPAETTLPPMSDT